MSDDPVCICLTAGDIGADDYHASDKIVEQHPDCPVHPDPI